MSAIEQTRRRYLPADGIKVLFVAEAPPADPQRFFYFEQVATHDWLFLAMMRALFKDARELEASELRRRKSEYLQRFKADGYYLVDARDEPMPAHATRATKRRLLTESLGALVERVRVIVGAETRILLISSAVHAACGAPLKAAGVNVINTEMIDFPSSGRQPHFQRKLGRALGSVSAKLKRAPWKKTADGSFLDENGAVVYFSCERFVESICIGNCCFICGANPSDKQFSNEHIFPKWLLRKFNLFDRDVILPNGTSYKYRAYKIPCCADCNKLMGRRVEEPVRTLIHGGHGAVADHLHAEGGLLFFVWMALIFLKTHLRDRNFNMALDRRASQDPISSYYEWESLHHIQTVARCFVSGAEIDRQVFGTCFILPAKEEPGAEAFDSSNLYESQVALLRCNDVAILTVFNDSTAVTGHLLRIMEKVTGPLSSLQLREVMVEAACCNLHLKERPQYASRVDLVAHTNRIVAMLPPSPEFHPVDLKLRGQLMEYALRSMLNKCTFVGYANSDDFWARVREGLQTFLYDDQGRFITEQRVAL